MRTKKESTFKPRKANIAVTGLQNAFKASGLSI